MKMIRPKSLLNLFYTLFLLVPMAAIGVRSAYITFNKNAKDSYSGESVYEINYKFESNEVNNYNDVLVDHIYQLNYLSLDQFTHFDVEMQFEILDGVLGITPNGSTDLYPDDLMFYSSGTCSFNFTFYDFSLSHFDYFNGIGFEVTDFDYYVEDLVIFIYSVDFDIGGLDDYSSLLFSYTDYNEIRSVTIDNSGTLDNAFTYSIHELIDNNLGKVNFFTWFGNMFLDMSKPQTALYINFVNWYFNYILLVSLGYLLFYVIMWFINYVRKLLDHNDTFGHGGY